MGAEVKVFLSWVRVLPAAAFHASLLEPPFSSYVRGCAIELNPWMKHQ